MRVGDDHDLGERNVFVVVIQEFVHHGVLRFTHDEVNEGLDPLRADLFMTDEGLRFCRCEIELGEIFLGGVDELVPQLLFEFGFRQRLRTLQNLEGSVVRTIV